jgi:hypothetical protein
VRGQPFRITRVWEKVAYVALCWILLPLAERFLLTQLGVPEPLVLTFDLISAFAVVGFGSRVFRATGEPVAPPRVWWRATGRPAAGFVIASLFVLGGVISLLPPDAMTVSEWWWYAAMSLPIVAFYLHSSIRLVRGDAPVPTKPKRDEDVRILKRGARL